MMEELDLDYYSPLQIELMEYITKHGPTNRSTFVKKLHAPRTTIFDNLTRLITEGILQKKSKYTRGKGRPHVFFLFKK